MSATETLVCTKCGDEKSTDDFYRRSDGARARYRMPCKACLRRSPRQKKRRRMVESRRPERKVLQGMIQRCHNPKNPSFRDYGARGISVCERWRDSFDAFLRDVGPRPSVHHTIERIDNDRSYEPGNCIWATRAEQNRNTRQNAHLTIDGRTQCRAAWAAESGIPAKTIRDRIERLGWSVRDAVFKPVDHRFGPKTRAS